MSTKRSGVPGSYARAGQQQDLACPTASKAPFGHRRVFRELSNPLAVRAAVSLAFGLIRFSGSCLLPGAGVLANDLAGRTTQPANRNPGNEIGAYPYEQLLTMGARFSAAVERAFREGRTGRRRNSSPPGFARPRRHRRMWS
jgi:hypothetical protein